MKRLLFVDNTIDHELYRPLEHFRPLITLPFDVCHAPTAEGPADLDRYTHILLSGSFASTLDDQAWINFRLEPIREAPIISKKM